MRNELLFLTVENAYSMYLSRWITILLLAEMMKTMKTTKCKRCWIEVEARWARKYCNKCRRIVDDELSAKYIEKHRVRK